MNGCNQKSQKGLFGVELIVNFEGSGIPTKGEYVSKEINKNRKHVCGNAKKLTRNSSGFILAK